MNERKNYPLTLTTMPHNETFNGWSNYDTWLAALWLNNDFDWHKRLISCQTAMQVEMVYDAAMASGYITDKIEKNHVDFEEILEDTHSE